MSVDQEDVEGRVATVVIVREDTDDVMLVMARRVLDRSSLSSVVDLDVDGERRRLLPVGTKDGNR